MGNDRIPQNLKRYVKTQQRIEELSAKTGAPKYTIARLLAHEFAFKPAVVVFFLTVPLMVYLFITIPGSDSIATEIGVTLLMGPVISLLTYTILVMYWQSKNCP